MSRRRIEAQLSAAAVLFAALGDETRLDLLRRLSAEGPASISALADGQRITRQAVTKHLNVLAAADLIRGEKRGREHVWAMNPDQLAQAQRCLELIGRGWEDALGRLKAFVES